MEGAQPSFQITFYVSCISCCHPSPHPLQSWGILGKNQTKPWGYIQANEQVGIALCENERIWSEFMSDIESFLHQSLSELKAKPTN
jgi:hypothetical protein